MKMKEKMKEGDKEMRKKLVIDGILQDTINLQDLTVIF